MTPQKSDACSDPVYTVGDYLLDRLAELGVSEIFGVPGDYNLQFLDHIVAHPTIRWVGSANELNAGYAADGYGRLRGMSAVVTTFGVGELSVTNAIAGSYAEHVPVVHIVGGPTKDAQGTRRALHHSLGDGDFEHFLRISREITCAQANLMPATAGREIDRVLSEVREQKRPGYILLSSDVARFPTEPPAAPLPRYPGGTSPRALSLFTKAAIELIADHQLTVLADLLVHRLQAVKELEALLAADVVPHATLMWGKSLLDESSPNFLGIYAGAASAERVRAAIEGAPVLVTAGVVFTDMVSGFFSQRIDPARTIDIGQYQSSVADQVFAPLEMSAALQALATILTGRGISSPPVVPPPAEPPPAMPARDEPLTQQMVWDRVCSALTPGNVVLADQGTSFYGMADHRLPQGVTFIGQPLWGSIGYTLPAAVGAAVAHPDRRTVLLIGDGAAQLTVQTRHVLPRRAVPGHRGGQQRWLHGRTGHPRRDGPVQRHRELELDRASQRAGCDQSPRVPCPNLWPTRRRPHRRRGTAGPDGARRGGVAAARDPPPAWPTRGIHGAAVRSLTRAGPSAQRCAHCSASIRIMSKNRPTNSGG